MAHPRNHPRHPSDREAIVLSILVSGEKYGLEVKRAVEAESGSTMPIGSLYTTLDRMESKGFVKSWMGETGQDRGGNRRRYFKITGAGAASLDAYRSQLASRAGLLSSLLGRLHSAIRYACVNGANP